MSERTKSSRSYSEPQLGMTPMIDVVFLLLVFFIVAFKPIDLLAKLPLNKPKASDTPADPPALTLTVTETGYLANNKRVSLSQIDQYLGHMNSKFGMDNILIICHNQSQHSALVQALDICAKNGIDKISLFSR